jgi:hypothetical protein
LRVCKFCSFHWASKVCTYDNISHIYGILRMIERPFKSNVNECTSHTRSRIGRRERPRFNQNVSMSLTSVVHKYPAVFDQNRKIIILDHRVIFEDSMWNLNTNSQIPCEMQPKNTDAMCAFNRRQQWPPVRSTAGCLREMPALRQAK